MSFLEEHFATLFESRGFPRGDMWKPDYQTERRDVRKCNTVDDLIRFRQMLREYGVERYKAELVQKKVLNPDMTNLF